MGICKCKRRTDLFCFVHHKAVCDNCICTDHPVCVVKTYVEWLTDSEYEPATCGVCKEILKPDNVIRLNCLDVFHPECLDSYAASLPRHTAKAGYLCPTCNKPIFPDDDNSAISQIVLRHLAQSQWAKGILSGGTLEQSSRSAASDIAGNPDVSNAQADTSAGNNNTAVSGNNGNNSGNSSNNSSFTPVAPATPYPASFNEKAVTPAYKRGPVGVQPEEARSNKPPVKDHESITIDADEDDNKYEKRSINEFLVNMGLKERKEKPRPKTRFRFDNRRALVLFALVSCVITVIVLGLSMTSDSPAGSA